MFQAIKSGSYEFPSPFWDDVDKGAKDTIGCLLVLDPRKRYTAEQVTPRTTLRQKDDGKTASDGGGAGGGVLMFQALALQPLTTHPRQDGSLFRYGGGGPK